MKKLRFLIIEQTRKENHVDLVQTIEKMGHEAHWFRLDEVILRSKQGKMVAYFGEDALTDFDIVMPRTVSSNLRLGRLVLRLCSKNQFVLDNTISKRDTFGKVSQAVAFLEANIPHPETLYTSNLNEFKKNIHLIKFPCIAKPVKGAQGRGISLVKSYREALQLFSKLTEDYLFQEYLPIQFDYRVFVVGRKVIGAIKRYVVPNDVRSNVSLGAKTEPAIVTPSMKKLALQAVAIFGYDVAGVDIVVVGSKQYVLEVNRTPQWQGLKKTLSIDPARAIVELCLQKHSLLQKKR